MRPAFVAAVVVTVGFAAACPPDDPCAADEPAYGGLGNDEVWLTLRDAKDQATTGGDAATITRPADAAVLPAADAPTFEWESPLKIALGLPSPSPPSPSPLFRRTPPTLFDTVGRALIPAARAHLAPVSSDVYLVDILVPGRDCPVSIVTSELSHTLDDVTWARINEGAAGEARTMQITSAYLANGRIDEGPFRAADVTFTIE